MMRTKRLRKLREELKHLFTTSGGDVRAEKYKRLMMDAADWLNLDEWLEISAYLKQGLGVESGLLDGESEAQRVQRVMEGDDQEAKDFLTELMGRMEEGVKKQHWFEQMKEFHRKVNSEGGAFQTTIIRPEYQRWMIENGEERCLEMLGNWAKVVRQGRHKPLCLGCEYEFKPDEHVFAFCVSVPFCEEPDNAIVTAICGECAQKDDEQLMEIAYGQYLEMGLANRKLEVGTA